MKNALLFYFIFLIGIVLTSCQSKTLEKTYTYTLEKTIEIPIAKEACSPINEILFSDIVKFHGKEVLVHYRPDFYAIHFYDIQNGTLIHTIPTEEYRLSGFHYHNEDSIFIMYENPWLQFEEFLKLIDITGKVKHNYHFDHPYEDPCIFDSYLPEESIRIENPINGMQYKDNKILFTFRSFNGAAIGTEKHTKQKTPILGVYDLASEKVTLSENYWYPNAGEGVYYPSVNSFLSVACFNEKGNPVVRYLFSSTLSEWDLKTNENHSISHPSPLLDTIKPMQKAAYDYPNSYEYHASYYNLLFDPYREMYYSLFKISNDFGNAMQSFTVCDKNMKFNTEIAVDKFNTYNPIFLEDYVVGFERNTENKIILKYYSVELQNKSQTNEVKTLRDSARRTISHQSAWFHKRFPIHLKKNKDVQ